MSISRIESKSEVQPVPPIVEIPDKLPRKRSDYKVEGKREDGNTDDTGKGKQPPQEQGKGNNIDITV